MERTITRIKNLKARRKLSLPASPNNHSVINSNNNNNSKVISHAASAAASARSHRTNSERYRRVQWSPDFRSAAAAAETKHGRSESVSAADRGNPATNPAARARLAQIGSQSFEGVCGW